MRTSRLTAVLERTLDAKAAQATDPDTTADLGPFDPNRTASAAEPAGGAAGGHDILVGPRPDGSEDLGDLGMSALSIRRSRSARRRGWLLASAAACVVVAVALTGTLVLRGDDAADLAVEPIVLGDPPDGWLVPTWLPEGMELWGLDISSYEQSDRFGAPTIHQLFGDPGAGRAVYVASRSYEISPGTARDVAVRGTTGSAGTGWGAAEEDLGEAVSWEERGSTFTALYRGVSRDEAVAFLDSLAWRTDDPRDGYAPPADDAWPLRAEATSRDSLARDATLLYSAGVPAVNGGGGDGVWVQTSSSSAISAGYLHTWYMEGSGDGTGPLVNSRSENELGIHWPDGRSVTVSPAGPSAVSTDVLERIAASTTVATAADLATLTNSTESRIAALPLAATADTTIGAVDIHADGGFVRLCLRRSVAAAPDCDTATTGGSARADGSATASTHWTIDGVWYVAVASRGEVRQLFGSNDRTAAPSLDEQLEAETTVVGDWTVQVVQPSPDVEAVCIGDAAAMTCTSQRPE